MSAAANLEICADWQEAVGKCIVTEETLLRIINVELRSVAPGSKVEALMPLESPDRNWRVALFDIGLCNAANEEIIRVEALGVALAGLSEIFVVAWPSADFQ